VASPIRLDPEKREGVGREGKEGKAEDAKPPPLFGASEMKATPDFLFFTAGLHYTASRLHGIDSPCTSSPQHLSSFTTVVLDGHHLAVPVPVTSKGKP
jgi:hypothetical protein